MEAFCHNWLVNGLCFNMYEMCYLRHDKDQRIDHVRKVAIKMYFRKMSNHPLYILFVCLFVLPDELLQGWKMNTILSEDFPGFSEMKTSPQCRLKLVNLNPNRTYLIKFVPSVGFSIILPKHPSSRASWWLKRPPFNKRMLWSGPPVAKHLPCCHVSLNNNLSNHGRSVLFETEELCLFLKKEMRN